MNGKAKLCAAVFFLSVFFTAAFRPDGARAFMAERDPFGFSGEDPRASAYSFGPFLKADYETGAVFALRPLFYMKRDKAVGSFGIDLLYPFFHYRRDPLGFRAGFLFNTVSFGGSSETRFGAAEKSFRIYPLVFYRRSDDPARRHFMFIPFYGNFEDRIKFVLFPLYLRTESPEGISRNILWPVFAFYSGGRKGFRFWPFFGRAEESGRKSRFALWPFYFETETDRGNIYRRHRAFFPFYYRLDYLTESHRVYLWPLFQKSVDPARGLESLHLPWPFVNFKTGAAEKRVRVFPLFEASEEANVKKTNFFLWPLYSSSRTYFETYEYGKKDFLIVLKVKRKSHFDKTRSQSLRVDLWPVFSYKRNEAGNVYFHLFSPLEPFIRSSEKLYRNYSFLWRVLEVRKKRKAGVSASVLFGVLTFKNSCRESSFHILGKALGYSSDLEGRKIRFLFLPVKIANPSKRGEDCIE